MKISDILLLFEENDGSLTTSELLNFGVTYYRISQLLDKEIISKITRGVYVLNGYNVLDEELVKRIIPKGVFCLDSSAYIYEYTTKIPSQYNIAIPRNTKYGLPNYPPIKLYRWSQNQYGLGMTDMEYNGSVIKIYDREKTICDYIRMRSKVETIVLKEVLNNYLLDKRRNLEKLKSYSKMLRVDHFLETYLSLSL